MQASLRLLAHRKFLPLFVTQFLGAFNDNLFKTAMILFATYAVFKDPHQESTFNADPQVPNLGRIAREEIDRRAARLHIPKLLVDGALKAPSGNGKSYQQRLQAVQREVDVWEQMRTTGDAQKQKELFRQLLAMAKENFLSMGIALPIPAYGAHTHRLHNVPKQTIWNSSSFAFPGPSQPSQWSIKE